jgi:hypothetical protein
MGSTGRSPTRKRRSGQSRQTARRGSGTWHGPGTTSGPPPTYGPKAPHGPKARTAETDARPQCAARPETDLRSGGARSETAVRPHSAWRRKPRSAAEKAPECVGGHHGFDAADKAG